MRHNAKTIFIAVICEFIAPANYGEQGGQIKRLKPIAATLMRSLEMSEVPVRPYQQLIYVSDISKSTEFYKKLFRYEPKVASPRYVVFDIDGKANFALWSGGGKPDEDAPRFNEIGVLVPTKKDVKDIYEKWKADSEIVFSRDLYTEVFGPTFLVKDPDGHMIRVSAED